MTYTIEYTGIGLLAGGGIGYYAGGALIKTDKLFGLEKHIAGALIGGILSGCIGYYFGSQADAALLASQAAAQATAPQDFAGGAGSGGGSYPSNLYTDALPVVAAVPIDSVQQTYVTPTGYPNPMQEATSSQQPLPVNRFKSMGVQAPRRPPTNTGHTNARHSATASQQPLPVNRFKSMGVQAPPPTPTGYPNPMHSATASQQPLPVNRFHK